MSEVHPRRLTLALTVTGPGSVAAQDFLARHSDLSRQAIEEVMYKGGVWLKQGGRKGRRRIRRTATTLGAGDVVELYYDRQILSRTSPEGRCLERWTAYSAWCKPAGTLSQGTDFGDHCSLLRQVEQLLGVAYLVHRLDRETAGLMLFAHGRHAAADLSRLFREGGITKAYRAEVRGDLRRHAGSPAGVIELPVDGGEARTEYEVLGYDAPRNLSTVEVTLCTGRTHQIRRHMAEVGHPIIGDPRYGRGNKNRGGGLRLVAYALSWLCPETSEPRRVAVDPDALLAGEIQALPPV